MLFNLLLYFFPSSVRFLLQHIIKTSFGIHYSAWLLDIPAFDIDFFASRPEILLFKRDHHVTLDG